MTCTPSFPQPSAISCAIALLALAPALAAAQTEPAAPAAAASAAKPSTSQLEQVVVTAQKTAENPQKVPLSINVINGEAVKDAGISNVNDLQGKLTGVSIVQQGPGASVQIRGVGSNPGGGNIDPSVAFSLDGVYQSRSSGAFGTMYDLDRIELLKGPQGTLYGRNATVGALNVISNKPSNVREGSADFEMGSYSLVRLGGMLNVPINDVVKFRVAAQHISHDGYLSDGYNDADDTAARLRVLIEPSKDFSMLLSADGHRKHGNGQGSIFTGTVSADGLTHVPARDDPSDPWKLTPVVPAELAKAGSTATGHYEPANLGLDVKNDGASAEMNWNLGASTLTAIGAWRRSYVLNQGSTGGSLIFPVFNVIDQSQKSLEVRLASNAAGPLKWLGGLFYIDENAPTLNKGQAATSVAIVDMTTVKSKSASAFGQATYSITSDTRATAGLRYTADRKQQQGRLYRDTGPLAQQYDQAVDTSFSDSAINYKVGVDHDLSKTAMVYASLSTGYKAGGLNFMPASSTGGDRHEFKPETLTALAIGAKSRWLDNTLQLNGELFYWRYKNQQVAIVDQYDSPTGLHNSPVANLLFVNNPGPSKIFGFDIDAVWRLGNDDKLTGALSYLHARNGTFVMPATNFVVCPFPVPACKINLESTTDVTGKTLPFSPTWSLNLGYQHVFGLASGATLTASYDVHAETTSYVNYHLYDPERQPGYARHNIALAYNTPDGNVTITAYVRNVGNVAVLARGSVGGGTASSAAAHYAAIMDPRTTGVALNVKF